MDKVSKFKNVEFKVSSLSNIHPSPLCVSLGKAKDGTFGIKDSKDPDLRNVLEFSEAEMEVFINGAKAGDFDFFFRSE